MSISAQDPILSIFHPGALGDGVLALPALRALRKRFPEYRMVWFGHKELGEVFVAAQEVHCSYSFDSLAILGFNGKNRGNKNPISDLLNRCERAVVWLNDTSGIWKDWIVSHGIKNFICRSPHDLHLRQHHMADRYVEILHPWLTSQQPIHSSAVDIDLESFSFSGELETVTDVLPSNEALIFLHPGSGSPNKCSPPALWAEVVKELMSGRPSSNICLLEGPADSDAVQKLLELLNVSPVVLAGLDLLSLSRYLQHSHLFIGHDSGLSHLASRFGIPSVVLFGPTDPSIWAPRGKQVTVLHNTCHCAGMEVVELCVNRPCLSFPTNTIITTAEKILYEMNPSPVV